MRPEKRGIEMNVKRCLQAVPYTNCVSASLLLVRLIMGSAFMLHGWGKIQNPMGWMGPDAPVPGILQFLAAFAEFGGGLALILGLLTALASLGLIVTMAVAVSMHMFVMKDPFVSMTGGSSYELALGYLGLAFLFLNAGPGKFSLDFKIFGHRA